MSSARLLQALKKISQETGESGDPSDWCLGEVISVSPLPIRIEDYDVDITVSHTTENRAGGGGLALFESHNHEYKGRKKITVHNGLHVGETVILLRQAGGQGFVVLSRKRNHTHLTGQWG